jgi:hypothetical protein
MLEIRGIIKRVVGERGEVLGRGEGLCPLKTVVNMSHNG